MSDEAIYQSDDYREKIVKQTPLTVEVDKHEVNAMVSAVVLAKRNVDAMHEAERDAHTFDRKEIRDIENAIRKRVAEASSLDKGETMEVTLSLSEVLAIQDGLVEARLSDRTAPRSMRMLDGLLFEELTV